MRYRKNVALILTRPGGEVLVCERSDFRDSWQFPQGGAHPDESLLEALQREVREEISLEPAEYRIVGQKGPYRYEFRPGFRKEGFDGQEQVYFLAEIVGDPDRPIRIDHEEFGAFRWIQPSKFRLTWVPPIKRGVYKAIFRDFFGLRLL
ncbi:MAG: NUDIX domain-containing protein [Terrimicrobiaceae bacterium]|nr:NUDIX domain-containing protein [Terrimicrobiaceae bacterium]